MGKSKFERTVSEKLKSRAIEASAGSWEQLSQRLDASEGNKKRPLIWWIGIAATIIGGILIIGSYFSKPVGNDPGFVNVPIEQSENKVEEIQQKPSEVNKAEEIVYEEKEEVINTSAPEKSSGNSGVKQSTIKNSKATLAAIEKEIEVQEPIQQTPEIKVADITKYSQSIENAVAEVVKQEKTFNITEAEVDALLAKAAAEISLNKNEKFTSENIDAEALLMEVEYEMEESFREKVFEVLKEGYLKARTAVANRNN